MQLLHTVQHLAWSYETGTFVEAVQRSAPSRHLVVLLGAGLMAGAGRVIFRKLTGGHAGELSETIWFHSGTLPPVSTLARAALSIVIVAMGASLGREGALKQTGAAVAATLAKWTRLTAPESRLLAIYGAGAGFAAAYNVPCGGAVFALEVLLGRLTLPLVVPALAASGIATAVSWILLPNRPTYTVPAYRLDVAQIVWALFAGPVLGLACVLYIRMIGWADARKPHGALLVVTPLLIFAVLGGISIVFPYLLGNGKDAVQVAFAGQFSLGLLLLLPALKLLASASCLGSGAPGGLFTPTLTYGSLLGGLLGYGWHMYWPVAPLGSYAIVGAGAVLAATMQGPVSAVILILELTWRIDPLMVPLLISVAGATLVTRRFETRSIYSARIRFGQAAAVERPYPAETNFSDLVRPHYEVISSAAHFSIVAQRLLALGGRPSSSLYVVDEKGHPVGVIRGTALSDSSTLPVVLETATAADLATSVETVPCTASREEVAQRLKTAGPSGLALVDSSDRLIGMVSQPSDRN